MMNVNDLELHRTSVCSLSDLTKRGNCGAKKSTIIHFFNPVFRLVITECLTHFSISAIS